MLSGMASSDGYRTQSDFILTPGVSPPPFTGKTRKKRKTREPFYKGYGVVYLPGDMKGLTDKLHLLLTEFFAGNTTVRNELVHVLDALLRLKQLTRREYTSFNMIVYKGRRFAVRRYEYGGSGIIDMVGSLLARYAAKAMLATAANTALRGTLNAAKKAIPHVIAHKLATTIDRKGKRIDKVVTGSQEPQLKKASVDTDGIDINALIDGSGIVLD